MSELGPNYSRSVPHYFSQLLISASKGSLPAVIAKDPSLRAERAPGTAVGGGAHAARAHAGAHSRPSHTAARPRDPGAQRPAATHARPVGRARGRRAPAAEPGPSEGRGAGGASVPAIGTRAHVGARAARAPVLRACGRGVGPRVSPHWKSIDFRAGHPPVGAMPRPRVGAGRGGAAVLSDSAPKPRPPGPAPRGDARPDPPLTPRRGVGAGGDAGTDTWGEGQRGREGRPGADRPGAAGRSPGRRVGGG